MVKILLPHNTWAYLDFITDEEKDALIEWMYSHLDSTMDNGHGRRYKQNMELSNDLPEVYKTVKNRIVETENLKDNGSPVYGDFISFNFEGASIHPHSDTNKGKLIHTRYNLLLSVPESGGEPIYGNELIHIQEKMLWRCQAGIYTHASKPVVGTKPRLNISFGFLV